MVTSRRWAPTATAALALFILWFSADAAILPDIVRGLAVGLALLYVPGFVVVRALRLSVSPSELPALSFSVSIACALPVLLAVSRSGEPLSAVLPLLTVVLVVIAALALISQPGSSTHADDPSDDGSAGEVRALTVIAAILGIVLTAGAWALTETGAIDRWWYLAYIRDYLTADGLAFSEPFLGTGFEHPRFALNAWLLMFATWSGLAAVDPVYLYERVAPLLLVPTALSAARLFAGSIFSARRTVWLAVVATALLWCGGSLFPILTRSVEDKILAALILAPVSIAAIARALNATSGGWQWVACAALALAAQSTVHPVVYMLTVLAAAPYVALMMAADKGRLLVGAALATALACAAIYPMDNGADSRALLEADGATLAQADHPVVRIHRSRDRLIELDGGGYIVHPRLLAHPIVIFALLSLFFLGGRSREERLFLLPATLLPLFICFVPPLATLAGHLGVPWMTYRVLWVVPFGLLAASGVERAASAIRLPALAGISLLAIGVLPLAADTVRGLTNGAHELQTKPSVEFTELARVLRTLDRHALIAAPPELAERLPAFARVNVLAMSDRATTVFSGSRRAAEPRLRANAMIAAGLWRETDDAPTPTHILTAPGNETEKYCAERLHEGDDYLLCRFEEAPSKPGVTLAQSNKPLEQAGYLTRSYAQLIDRSGPDAGDAAPGSSADKGSENRRLFMRCSPQPNEHDGRLVWERPGPWSGRSPGLLCRVHVGRNERVGRMVAARLHLTAFVGPATDEFIVEARAFDDLGQRWSVRTRIEVSGTQKMEFRLPRAHMHTLEVTIVPTHLPFVKLTEFALTFEDAVVTTLGGIALD